MGKEERKIGKLGEWIWAIGTGLSNVKVTVIYSIGSGYGTCAFMNGTFPKQTVLSPRVAAVKI